MVVRRPARVLLVALVATLACVPLLLKLRLDTDVLDLFPRHSVETEAFARFSRAFIAEQVLIVLVESDDPARLTEFVDRYAAELRKLPLVADVRHRLSGGAGKLVRDHLLALLDEDELAQLAPRLTPDALRAQARRLRGLLSAPGGSSLQPVLTSDPLEILSLLKERLSSGLPVDASSGYFRSTDGKAMVLYVRPRTEAFDTESDRALISSASAAAERLGARVTDGEFHGGAQPVVGFTGACAYALHYRDWLHRDMSLSTAVSAIAVLVLFALFFRALRVLPLVGGPLFVGLAWTATAAVVLYGRINAVSLAFGTLLLSIGIDLPIQLYNRLREALVDHPPLEALETTVRDLAGPSLTATLGPAAVFFACALSDYKGLAELGVLAGVGLLFNLIAMLTIFPSLLALLPPRLWATRAKVAVRGPLARLGDAAARRPRVVLVAALIFGAIAVPLAMRVQFERRLATAIQPKKLPPVRVEHELERRFGERSKMVVPLVEDADPERALERSDLWAREAERLRRRGLIRGYEAISSLFPSQATQAARRARLLALDPKRVARDLRAALEEVGFDPEPFAPFLTQLEEGPPPLTLSQAGELDFLVHAHVHDDAGGRRVATFIYPKPGEEGARAIAEMRQFAAGPAGGVVTGTIILEDVLRQIVERDTRRVTLASTALVIALLALYYRRWRPFVAVTLPLLLAWIGFAAALALFDLPLNLFNLLSVPLVIGYGIDDHVFLVHRHELDPSGGPGRTLQTTGRAIVLTSLSTMAGFAGLAVARFDGLRLLGLSGALAVAMCLAAAFAVLPALLALLWKR
jgi:predicted RND superfamily exporter protein